MPTTPTEEEQHLAADTGSTADPTAAPTATADEARPAPAGERRSRTGFPLVPLLSGLLVLLLAGLAFLWFSRPDPSAIRTDVYSPVLQAARSAVVDFTSFDHLTFDDDVEEVRRVSTEEFAEQSVASLEERRQEILELEAVVSTEIIGAGVTTADVDEATVALLIQTTRRTSASEQADVAKYSLQVTMEKQGDRWLLASIAGTGSG